MASMNRLGRVLGLLLTLSLASPVAAGEGRRIPFRRAVLRKRPVRACVPSGAHAQFFSRCCRRGFVRGSVTGQGDGGGICR